MSAGMVRHLAGQCGHLSDDCRWRRPQRIRLLASLQQRPYSTCIANLSSRLLTCSSTLKVGCRHSHDEEQNAVISLLLRFRLPEIQNFAFVFEMANHWVLQLNLVGHPESKWEPMKNLPIFIFLASLL